MSVLEAGAKQVVVTHPDELLYDAVGKMLHAWRWKTARGQPR